MAEALIGQDYMVSAAQGRFVQGSPCEFVSGGVVWMAGKEQSGWFDAVAVCDNAPVLILAKNRASTLTQGDSPVVNLPWRKIVAVQALPPVGYFSNRDMGPDPLVLVDPVAGQCSTDLPDDPPVYVLLRWGGRRVATGAQGIEAVWSIDLQKERFVPIDPQHVECEQLSMD
ncbi:hypothetical protein [Acidovorax sp.]|uniref:hypothetical protein n=1 Tax=Acidovorax sp. TaxID=1872122 RepID=UPI00391BB2E3